MKREFKILFLLLLLLAGVKSYAQIGGNTTPLQYSVHTYSIVMGNSIYTPSWGVYIAGTTQLQIENNTATPLIDGTHYTLVTPIWKNVGSSYFKIQFSTIANGPLAQGDYVIGYKETTNDANLCVTASIRNIHVYGPFDIDLSLNDPADAADCPDNSNVPKLPGDYNFQTTVLYLVTIEYPSLASGGYEDVAFPWMFNFQIIIDGFGAGANATIASITASGVGMLDQTWGAALGSSNFTGSCSITPSSISPVTFTVVYNDVLGVEQNISFQTKDIKGSYGEQDIDEINGTAGNSLTNKIYSMPVVGDILAWN